MSLGRTRQTEKMHQCLQNTYGGLREYWYVACESRQLKKGRSKRTVVLGIPLLLWRNSQGNCSIFLDSCPHRQAPLSQGKMIQGNIRCPYHGWEFNDEGNCKKIPVLGETSACQPRLIHFPSHEDESFLWVFMGEKDPPPFLPTELSIGMRTFICMRIFHAAVEDLAENFIDSPHTNFVHPGLIRGQSQSKKRHIFIQSDLTSVTSTHEPVHEKVGVASRFINPNQLPVQHSDRFYLPSCVDIRYAFGDQSPNFVAEVFLTPIKQGVTSAFFRIRVNFPAWNRSIRLGLSLLAPLVLWQDRRILQLQKENREKLDTFEIHDFSVPYDQIGLKLRELRKWAQNPTTIHKPVCIQKKIEVFL